MTVAAALPYHSLVAGVCYHVTRRGHSSLTRRSLFKKQNSGDRDHSGQQLAYVYFEEEPGRRSAAKLLTKGEARRIAANVAKLPELWPHISYFPRA